MVNKVVKHQIYNNFDQEELPISPVTAKSAYSLEHKAGVLDYFKQASKSASSRGPLFWACLCFILLIITLGLIALIIFLVYYVGLPSIQILGVQLPTGANETDIQNQSQISINLGQNGQAPGITFEVQIMASITNPNKLDLSFQTINIEAFDPLVPDLKIGTATLQNIVLPKQGQLALTVPLTVSYSFVDDPTGVIPNDLVNSCTVAPGATSPEKQLSLNLKIIGKLKITSLIKITLPAISSTPSFNCPQSIGQNVNILGHSYNLRALNFTALAEGNLGLLPSSTAAASS